MPRFTKSGNSRREFFNGKHKFEHWYRDSSVYFITARCRGGHHAFASAEAQAIFWDRMLYYAAQNGLELWIVTLMVNHYHIIGYMKSAALMGQMMRKLHGSVAKLVNDLLPVRQVPFWREGWHHDYFDGCLRDPLQLSRAHRYTHTQGERAGLVKKGEPYSGTRIFVGLEEGTRRAIEVNAFLPEVPYARYSRAKRPAGPT